jgi:hypothetical protein
MEEKPILLHAVIVQISRQVRVGLTLLGEFTIEN